MCLFVEYNSINQHNIKEQMRTYGRIWNQALKFKVLCNGGVDYKPRMHD